VESEKQSKSRAHLTTTWYLLTHRLFTNILANVNVAAKLNKEGKPEQCKPINKVEWITNKNG